MHVKDAMRERSIADLVDAIYRLLGTYRSSDPGLAVFLLTTLQRYISWMDINLVANKRRVAAGCHA